MRNLLLIPLPLAVFLTLMVSPLLCDVTDAAEPTEVIDAADGDDPFDFTGEVFYRRHLRRAKITREYNCNPAQNPLDATTCPTAGAQGQITNVKELRYQRNTHEIVPRFHLGLWKDFEFLIEMPIVIQDTQTIRFAGDGGEVDGKAIDADLSSISPSMGQRLFDIPIDSNLPIRSGFGDMLFKFRFAPVSAERDDTRGEWVLELGYRAPTGTEMRYGNLGVGRGVHEVEFGTSFSRRFKYIEPYASFEASIPFASTINSPFQQYTGSQEYVTPGARGRFDMGIEFIPYDHPESGAKFFIDLGLGAAYQAEGRDYSELFDALAIGALTCNRSDMNNRDGKENCGYYNEDARIDGDADQAPVNYDGITTVEEFMTIRGHLGFGFYVSPNFKFGARAALAHETEHNISTAEIGKDVFSEGDMRGLFIPATDINQQQEHNPTFVPTIDHIGRRIRIEETTVFSVAFNMALMF